MKTKLSLKKETVEILSQMNELNGGNGTAVSIAQVCYPKVTDGMTCGCPSNSCPKATYAYSCETCQQPGCLVIPALTLDCNTDVVSRCVICRLTDE